MMLRTSNLSKIGLSFGFLLVISQLIASCGSSNLGEISPSTPQESYVVDPIFREFYNYLGAEKILGAPISAIFYDGPLTCQLTANAKMLFNPQAPTDQRFQLAPIGREMEIIEPPVQKPENPESRYSNGHIIYPDFIRFYDKIGPRFIGKPLTEVRFNPIRKRYEQYFENLGLYRLEESSGDEIQLLAYGSWICETRCMQKVDNDSSVEFFKRTEQPFQGFISSKGIDFTGFPLTGAYVSNDGRLEQIFENVVLAVDANDPNSVYLRPVSQYLNILPGPTNPPINNEELFFFEVGGDKGYNIPIIFWDYLSERGGIELVGPPIGEFMVGENRVISQCFQNICLETDLKQGGSSRVLLQPLGYFYRQIYFKQLLSNLGD
jgi:hypothetical protein